jgi:hypothetical protein
MVSVNQGQDPAAAQEPNDQISIDRRRSRDRRSGADRRQQGAAVVVERRVSQRRKVSRRRQIDPTTCERDYSLDEIEFMQAMDSYKRSSGRMFPTCSEILEVIRSLGYAKANHQSDGEGAEASPTPGEEPQRCG